MVLRAIFIVILTIALAGGCKSGVVLESCTTLTVGLARGASTFADSFFNLEREPIKPKT